MIDTAPAILQLDKPVIARRRLFEALGLSAAATPLAASTTTAGAATLPPGTLITIDNLAQAIAQIAGTAPATLPAASGRFSTMRPRARDHGCGCHEGRDRDGDRRWYDHD